MTSLSPAGAPGALEGDKFVGLACGMGAGALWGLVFLAPKLVGDFGPLHLTVGRYLCYGLIAALLLAPRWRAVCGRLSRQQWRHLAWLAWSGNILYYLLLSAAVQAGGIAMTSLVIGFLPVAVTVIGSRDRAAPPMTALLPSLLLCAAGAFCIGWHTLTQPSVDGSGSPLLGLAFAVGALASWTAYAVGNARALHQLRGITPHEWNLLTGLLTGAQSLALVPVALLFQAEERDLSAWAHLAVVSLGLAVLASILGNGLWNRMSRLLPLTMVGQMILFETVFALIYGLLWEQRLPTPVEAAALVLVILSVVCCLRAHRSPA